MSETDLKDKVRISEGGEICIITDNNDASLIVEGDLIVHGTCTCDGEPTAFGFFNTEFVDVSYEGGDSDGSIGRPWLEIQDAVDNAGTRSRIYIYPGVYTEQVVIPENVNLMFQGAARGTVIVQSAPTWSPSNPPVFRKMQGQGSDNGILVFEELTIRNGNFGVRVSSAQALIVRHCIFTHNGWSGLGLSLVDGESFGLNASIPELEAYWNGPEVAADKSSAAIYLRSVLDVSIHDNVLDENFRGVSAVDCGQGITFGQIYRNTLRTTLLNGIEVDASSLDADTGCENIVLCDNDIHGAGFRGVLVRGGADVRISECDIRDAWVSGIELSSVSNTVVDACRLRNCTLNPYATNGETLERSEETVESGAVVISGRSGRRKTSYTARVTGCSLVGLPSPYCVIVTRGIVLSGGLSEIDGANIDISGNHLRGFDIATKFLPRSLSNREGVTTVTLTHADNVYEVGNKQNLLNLDGGSYVEYPYSNLYPNASHGINIIPLPSCRSVVIEPCGDMFAFNQLYASRKANNRIVIREQHQDKGNRIIFDDIDPCAVYINFDHVPIFGCPTPSPFSVDFVVNQINATLFYESKESEGPHFMGPFHFSVVEGRNVNIVPTVSGSGMTFSSSPLPAGLVMTNANTGRIQGTAPAYRDGEENFYTWTMTTANSAGSESNEFSLQVEEEATQNFTDHSVMFNSGSQQYVQLPNATDTFPMAKSSYGNTNPDDAWTLSLWLKPDVNAPGIDMGIFDYGLLRAKVKGNGAHRSIEVSIGTEYNYIIVEAPNAVSLGSWHHVVLSYNGNASGVASDRVHEYYSAFKIYVNGTKYAYQNGAQCSDRNYGYAGINAATQFNMGANFQGLMDEVIVASGQLADSQVSSLFNNGVPVDPRDLDPGDIWTWQLNGAKARWWRMGDGGRPDAYPQLFDELHPEATDSRHVLEMMQMVASNIVSEGAEV